MTTPTPTPATMNVKRRGSRFMAPARPPHHHVTAQHVIPTSITISTHSCFMSEQLSLIPKSVSSTSQTTSTMTVYSSLTSSHHLSIAPSTTPRSYLNGKFPHLFLYILIVLSVRSTAATLPPPSLLIPPANTQQNRLETCLCLEPKIIYLFIYIVLMFIYCHHQTHHNGHHILMVATSPPHQPTQ